MKHNIFLTLAVAMVFCACNPESISYSGQKVKIDIDVTEASCAFIDVTFTPDKPAFYLSDIIEAVDGIDLDKVAPRFMNLALDSAYVEYVGWRHSYLMEDTEHIADFTSHSLNYGKVNITKNFLKADTKYWVFAFVVDNESNKANGRLFWKEVTTLKESKFSDTRYAYRVRGDWDYVYPYEPKKTIIDPETGKITLKDSALVKNVAWAGISADSLDLRKRAYEDPGAYFREVYNGLNNKSSIIHKGVYAHWNNGVGDGSTSTEFIQGHTYYTAMATLDGDEEASFDIYKFTYTGMSMELMFYDEDNTFGSW